MLEEDDATRVKTGEANNIMMKTLILMFFVCLNINLSSSNLSTKSTAVEGGDGCIVFQLTNTPDESILVKYKGNQVVNVFFFPSSSKAIFADKYKDRTTYTGNYTENKLSFCLHNVTSADTGIYKIDKTEYTVNLTVLVPVSIVNISTLPVEMDTDPITVIEGRTRRIQCKTNPVLPSAVIKWYLGLRSIKNETNTTVDDANTNPKISISEIYFTSNRSDDQKYLYCTAENIDSIPAIISAYKTLDILYGPGEVNIYPSNQTYIVVENSESIGPIQCTALCKPNCAMTWIGPGLVATNTSYLNILNITRIQTGNYYCKATNDYGNRSSLVINVIVQYAPNGTPIITQSPTSVINGGIVKLTCELSGGKPQPMLTWDCGKNSTNNSSNAMASYSVLLLNVNRYDNGKRCHCLAMQSATGYSSKVEHIIIVFFAPDKPLKIIQSPEGPIDTDTYVTLTCEVSGGNPLATLEWNCGGSYINNSSGNTSSYSSHFKVNSTYNGKQCTCSAKHRDQSYNSTKHHLLNVYYPPSTPDITLSPNSPVFEGNMTIASCIVYDTGNPKFATMWKWNQTGLDLLKNETISIGPVTKQDNGHVVSCSVYNIYTTRKGIELQANTTLNVEYYPVVVLDPNTESKSITIVEGNKLNVKCVVHGNPTPKADWFYEEKTTPFFEGHNVNLTFSKVKRHNKGRYYCKATSFSTKFGYLVRSAYVDLIIHYPPDVSINYFYNTEKEQEVAFVCNATGNPDSYTYTGWKQTYNGKIIRNSEQLFKHTQNNSKQLTLRQLSFKDSGNYTCFVNNGVPDLNLEIQQFGSKQIDIKGKPELLDDLPADDTFSAKRGGNLTIQLRFISFPDIIEAFWYKNSSNTPIKASVHDDISASVEKITIETTFYGKPVNVSNYAYHATLDLGNLDKQVEGEYILVLKNGFNDKNISMFVVISSIPDDPSDLNITQTTSTEVTITWNRGYSGGHTQYFNVSVHDSSGIHCTYLINDSYTEITQMFTITDLNPSTKYVIHLHSVNEIGKSNVIKLNTTTEATNEVPGSSKNVFPTGAVVGGIAGVVLACVVIIVIIYIKRKCFIFGKDPEGTGRKKLTDVNKEVDDEEGLKDNILYESAGQDFTSKQGPSGVEYAVVTKNKDTFTLNGNSNVQETSLYSEVMKKPKVEQKAEVYTNVVSSKKLKKKEKGKNNESLEDVYENMSRTVDNKKSCSPEQQQINKDGLVYAELVFNLSPNGPKFIHGIDDRTIYSDVDTTQKIDPLPDSDEEDTIEEVTQN